jgi:hypothetical protein
MNMKNFLAIIISLNFTTLNLFAQELPSIQTDRPDQTECPFIVPKNFFQAEFGFVREKFGPATNFIYPSVLWKYGLNNKTELRLITEFAGSKIMNSKATTNLNPITVGFKTKIADEKGIVPDIGFIGHLTLNKVASSNTKTTFAAPSFRFNFQHTLNSKTYLAYNLGAQWNGDDGQPNFLYTLTSGYMFTNKLSAYIEWYGFLPQNDKPDHRFDGGITYLIRPNFMVDVSGGFGLSTISPEGYLSLGFSFRLPK